MRKVNRAYVWHYIGNEYVIELVKNEIWRWYVTTKRFNSNPASGIATGSNRLTVRGVILDLKRKIDEDTVAQLQSQQKAKEAQ